MCHEVSYMYIHMWDMTHGYIWGMSYVSRVVKSLVVKCPACDRSIRVTWLIHSVRHNSCIYEEWVLRRQVSHIYIHKRGMYIHVWDMTHAYMRNESCVAKFQTYIFIREVCIFMYIYIHICIYEEWVLCHKASFGNVPSVLLIHTCDYSFIRVTWLIHVWDMTHSCICREIYVRHDSCIYEKCVLCREVSFDKKPYSWGALLWCIYICAYIYVYIYMYIYIYIYTYIYIYLYK